MKKTLHKIAFTLFLGGCWYASAQENPKEVSTAFYEQQVQTFRSLDPTQVPTGILFEHSFPFTDLKSFDGVIRNDVYVDAGMVKDIYKTVYSGIIDDTNPRLPVLVEPEVFENDWYNMRNTQQVVLAGTLFKYNLFKENARAEGLATINSNGAVQVTSGKNPYTEKYTVALSPGLIRFYGKELNVVLPSTLFKSNEINNIDKIEVDFEDGNGFRVIQPNQSVPVQYAETGTKEWRYKVKLKSGLILDSRSRIIIVDWTNPIPIAGSVYCGSWNSKKTITATKSYLGKYGKLNLTIRCSGDNVINNPLIVVEGFDIGNLFDPENEYGTTTIQSFRQSLDESIDLQILLENSNRQYDIIYVDWIDGMDYMERNAYALEEAIKWVNSIKQGNNPNVIVGQSMGGVVARYALTNMENHNEAHDANLFISHDAPHQGAMIPDSYQHMYRHITNQYIKIKKGLLGSQIIKLVPDEYVNIANGIAGMLDQPGAKQLLKVWVAGDHSYNSTVHTSFYTNLRQMNNNSGYPTLTRNISLSNGSECGATQAGVSLGGDLINLNFNDKPTFVGGLWRSIVSPIAGMLGGALFEDANFVRAGFVGLISTDHQYSAGLQAKAMKESGLAGNIYHAEFIYRYKILGVFKDRITLFDVNKNGRSYGAYEYYGGGNYQLYDETDPEDSAKFGSSGSYTLSVAPRFGFIPTVSGLDIGHNTTYLGTSAYKSEYVGANPPTGSFSSSFVNFSTDFNRTNSNHHNYRHITFNPRNGQWLASELNAARNSNNNQIFTDCSFFCGVSEITGSDFICDNANYTYSIPEIQGVSVSWSVSGLQIVSGQGTANLVVKNNGGLTSKSITATISSSTCGVITLEKNVHAGNPSMLGSITGTTLITVFNNQNYSLPLTYTAPLVLGATYYEWIFPGNYQVVPNLGVPTYIPNSWELLASTANTNQITVKSNLSTNGQIKVRACNECGCSNYITLNVTHQHHSNPGYEIAPSPIYDGILTIMWKREVGPIPEFSGNFTNVYIYDLQARKVHQFEMNSEGGTTNVSHLAPGVYKVHIDMQNGNFEVLNLSVSK